MSQADTLDWRWRWAESPLLRAFAISIALHLLFFSGLEVGNRLNLWRFSPFALLRQLLPGQPVARLKQDPKLVALEQPKPKMPAEMPLVFVDVDPAQASQDKPDSTPYYSAVNSRAANPDTSRDTPTPKLDGKQDKVLKTMDTDRAKPVPQPLQPAPKPQPQPTAEEVAEQQPQKATPLPKPSTGSQIGDLASAKPTPNAEAKDEAGSTVEPTPKHVRPRTLAAVQAQKLARGESALIGEKIKQEGGVRRFAVESSLDVSASPLGNYDARFIEAVQECWYNLLRDQHYSLDRVGRVVLDFRLTYDGRIEAMRVVDTDVGEIYTMMCQLAITKPSPFEKWPIDMRKMIGAEHRDVRFTFYY